MAEATLPPTAFSLVAGTGPSEQIGQDAHQLVQNYGMPEELISDEITAVQVVTDPVDVVTPAGDKLALRLRHADAFTQLCQLPETLQPGELAGVPFGTGSRFWPIVIEYLPSSEVDSNAPSVLPWLKQTVIIIDTENASSVEVFDGASAQQLQGQELEQARNTLEIIRRGLGAQAFHGAIGETLPTESPLEPPKSKKPRYDTEFDPGSFFVTYPPNPDGDKGDHKIRDLYTPNLN